jgi:hypothetical protein
MKEIRIILLLALVASLALLGAAPAALATQFFTFPTSSYDNIANTVTAGPTTNNLQTAPSFRDALRLDARGWRCHQEHL